MSTHENIHEIEEHIEPPIGGWGVLAIGAVTAVVAFALGSMHVGVFGSLLATWGVGDLLGWYLRKSHELMKGGDADGE